MRVPPTVMQIMQLMHPVPLADGTAEGFPAAFSSPANDK